MIYGKDWAGGCGRWELTKKNVKRNMVFLGFILLCCPGSVMSLANFLIYGKEWAGRCGRWELTKKYAKRNTVFWVPFYSVVLGA